MMRAGALATSVENRWKMASWRNYVNDFSDEHPLGKGEVVSSILPGSTRKARELGAFLVGFNCTSATQYATKREHDGSTRGKSVDFVRETFR